MKHDVIVRPARLHSADCAGPCCYRGAPSDQSGRLVGAAGMMLSGISLVIAIDLVSGGAGLRALFAL
ncbi:hypothetical protein [Sphingomonas sp. UYP23]